MSPFQIPPQMLYWNARREPPWVERDLIDKLARARRYGREPIGGLLDRR
jgi:hypothetical protein